MHTFGLFSLYPVARIHGALTPRCRVMLTALCVYHARTHAIVNKVGATA